MLSQHCRWNQSTALQVHEHVHHLVKRVLKVGSSRIVKKESYILLLFQSRRLGSWKMTGCEIAS